jgi:outer membrane lipopolysaccharide assembly protein LptE/RlpB
MWWSSRILWAALAVLLFLPACGYQLTAQAPIDLPQDSTRLFLGKVVNPTTATWFEPMLRTSLRDELTRRGNVTWVGRDEAQATVNIDVRAYSTSDVVKGRDDVTLKSEAHIQMEVTFFDAKTNALIWTSGPVMASESYRGAEGKRIATEAAIELATRMVADRLSQKF